MVRRLERLQVCGHSVAGAQLCLLHRTIGSTLAFSYNWLTYEFTRLASALAREVTMVSLKVLC